MWVSRYACVGARCLYTVHKGNAAQFLHALEGQNCNIHLYTKAAPLGRVSTGHSLVSYGNAHLSSCTH